LLCLFLSRDYTEKRGIKRGEYYVLFMLSAVGMMLMGASSDLVILFLGLELMSVCFYILTGMVRTNLSSNEASMKYFLLGAFATGFLLYGIALVYGASGTTNIPVILDRVLELSGNSAFLIGIGLLVVGFSFKVAAVPFHMWVPDVYEGAPTTVTAFMAAGGKAAGFSIFLLVFAPAMVSQIPDLRGILAIVSAASMVVGNIMALAQSSVKRMLAYSSIAHAGYILTGLVAANTYGSNGVLFYLLAYAVMNVGAFGVLSILESREGESITYESCAGLSKSSPMLALLSALFMFSLTGIPPFAGFFGKYYVFAGAIQAGFTWLAVLGVLMSLVSTYYYLRLVVVMFFREDDGPHNTAPSWLGMSAIVFSALALVIIGVFPDLVLNLTIPLF
jgi:NADH-quinone oxidoreductase subunit N